METTTMKTTKYFMTRCSFCSNASDRSLGYPTPHKIRYCPNCYRQFGLPMWDFLIHSYKDQALLATNQGCSMFEISQKECFKLCDNDGFEFLASPPRGFKIFYKPGEALNLPLFRFFGLELYSNTIIIKRR